MRPGIKAFAREVAAAMPVEGPVVEIGARAAAGQEGFADVRSLFPGVEYIGCDVQPGAGVDQIEDVHHLSFADDSVGAVVSFDTLEHVADPLRAVREMHRVLRPGGFVAITSVMFFPIHAHPWDYWRFTPEGFELLLEPFETKLVLAHGWDLMPETVLGVGVKGPFDLRPELFPDTARAAQGWATRHGPVDFGPIRLTVRDMWRRTLKETTLAARRKLARAARR